VISPCPREPMPAPPAVAHHEQLGASGLLDQDAPRETEDEIPLDGQLGVELRRHIRRGGQVLVGKGAGAAAVGRLAKAGQADHAVVGPGEGGDKTERGSATSGLGDCPPHGAQRFLTPSMLTTTVLR
jgi:hypothetical protein